MRPPTTLPPGTCLTDRWPFLPQWERRAWLQIVEREARAMRIEAERARQLRAHTSLSAAAIEAVLRPTDTPAARAHRYELLTALDELAADGFRVQHRPRRTSTTREQVRPDAVVPSR